jgi:glycosyltransferase involved in cell wall biosynthesis
MRIAIDAHSIGSGQSGNETYYRSLLTSLLRLDSENDYRIYYTRRGALDRLGLRNGRFTPQPIWPTNSFVRIPFGVPRELRSRPVDVFHAQFIVPPFVKCRTVTTIPDIAYEHYPEFFPRFHVAWSSKLVPWSARRADHVITVSHYSKADLVNLYKIDPDKVTVTYEAAAEEFCVRDRGQAREYIARHYGIDRPIVLYVGRLQGRKNLVRLIEAYSMARRRGVDHQLVLVGKKEWMVQSIVEKIVDLKLSRDVILTGYVASADLPWFYSAAEIFAYPSIFEGFGLPVLEAMACGIPVITSRGSSLEEVAGGAAMIVDPFDIGSLNLALERLLGDEVLRNSLARAGIRRSKQFNCDQTAIDTIEVYRRVAGSESHRCCAQVGAPV